MSAYNSGYNSGFNSGLNSGYLPLRPSFSRVFSCFNSFASAGLGAVFEGRRLRVKVIDLAGTMSNPPSQESAFALFFFAGGGAEGWDWSCAKVLWSRANRTEPINIARKTSRNFMVSPVSFEFMALQTRKRSRGFEQGELYILETLLKNA